MVSWFGLVWFFSLFLPGCVPWVVDLVVCVCYNMVYDFGLVVVCLGFSDIGCGFGGCLLAVCICFGICYLMLLLWCYGFGIWWLCGVSGCLAALGAGLLTVCFAADYAWLWV